MISLPDVVPGVPDVRSPGAYQLWLGRRQWRTLGLGVAMGIAWMLSQAMVPFVVGRAIDEGVATRDGGRLALWCAVLAGLGVFTALTGVLRHRMAVANWLQASLRSSQLVGHHLADAGMAVTSRATTGEAVSTVANDANRMGEVYDVTARLAGAVVSYVAIGVILLTTDLVLGTLVLVGVPLLTLGLVPVVAPLQRRQAAQREAEGRLTALGADTVAGLRVLRGIGGEEQFVARYRARSQEVRRAGVRVAGVQATLDTAQVLLPGAFVVALTWLGARSALAGRITAGELVTLYGYAAFLVMPLMTAAEAMGKAVRSRVAATRIVSLLRLVPAHRGLPHPGTAPPPGAVLEDPASGLRLEPGLLTALVAAVTDDAAVLADRLARLETELPADAEAGAADGPGPRLGGVRLADLPIAVVRGRIAVSEAEPRLFSGTLRAQVDPYGRHDDAEVRWALDVADAGDVLDAMADGLDTPVEERGRSLSGGQRQRLALARAVLADPEVLVLVEPTSSVDAHTEARVAERLRAARAGRTTLVTTASPLVLDRADRVLLMDDGRVVAEGTHRELLHTERLYRDTVLRGEGT